MNDQKLIITAGNLKTLFGLVEEGIHSRPYLQIKSALHGIEKSLELFKESQIDTPSVPGEQEPSGPAEEA